MVTHYNQNHQLLFLAAMSSSRSDVDTKFVRPTVSPLFLLGVIWSYKELLQVIRGFKQFSEF